MEVGVGYCACGHNVPLSYLGIGLSEGRRDYRYGAGVQRVKVQRERFGDETRGVVLPGERRPERQWLCMVVRMCSAL